MEILTYPIGLVVGMLPVVANLGPPGSLPAQLLLDGRPACAMSAEAPRCTVDLGSDLHVHLLELVRTDGRGAVVERTTRWVNGPGAQAEVYLRGGCDKGSGECTVSIGWGHPGKLDPRAMVVTLDGQPILREVQHEVRFRAEPGSDRVVSVDVIFPDGRRASQIRALGAGYSGFAEASLQPIAIVPGEGAAALQTIGGMPVRGLEDAPAEVAFVVEPDALGGLLNPGTTEESDVWGRRVKPADPRRVLVGDGLSAAERVTAVIPNSTLNRIEISPAREWLPHVEYGADVLAGKRMRLADAVASAGLLVAGAPHKRAVVLVISGHHRDESAFTPEQVRRYLSEVMVPLVVWRLRQGTGSGWPEGPRITSGTILSAVESFRVGLDAQRIAWVEGTLNPATVRPREDERGFAIAGRTGVSATVVAGAAGLVGEAGPTPSAPVPAATPGRGVRGKVDVTAVRVLIRPQARDGTPVEDLAAEEVTVLEDGAPVRVLGIDRMATAVKAPKAVAGAPGTTATPTPAARPWGFTFYIVPELCTPAGISRILDRVRSEAQNLVALGRVTVVLADPTPRLLGQPAKDGAALEQLLGSESIRRVAPSRIAQIRRDFLSSIGVIEGLPSPARPDVSPQDAKAATDTNKMAMYRNKMAQARVAFAEERSVLRSTISCLVDWSRLERSSDPRVLFLAMDGFDLDPGGFYLAMFEPDPRNYQEVALYKQVSAEFLAQQLGPLVEEAAAALAERGWTAVTFDNGVAALAGFTTSAEYTGHGKLNAFYEVRAGASGATFLFMNPRDPLRTVAETTGGLMLPPSGSMGSALDTLSNTLLLAYQVERPADGKAHRVEIRTTRPGVQIVAPKLIFSGTPEGESEMRARRILSGEKATGGLPVELAVIAEGDQGKSGMRKGELRVRVDFTSLKDVLVLLGKARMRVTVAVEVAGAEPFVAHQEAAADPTQQGTSWGYSLPLTWPPKAKQVVVIVEELATAAWGSGTVALPRVGVTPDGTR